MSGDYCPTCEGKHTARAHAAKKQEAIVHAEEQKYYDDIREWEQMVAVEAPQYVMARYTEETGNEWPSSLVVRTTQPYPSIKVFVEPRNNPTGYNLSLGFVESPLHREQSGEFLFDPKDPRLKGTRELAKYQKDVAMFERKGLPLGLARSAAYYRAVRVAFDVEGESEWENWTPEDAVDYEQDPWEEISRMADAVATDRFREYRPPIEA